MPSPKIIEIEQTQAPTGRSVTMPRASAPERLASPALYRGLDELGAGGERLGVALAERQEESARAWAIGALSKARLDWTKHFYDRQENAQPGAPNFTPELLGEYDKYASDAIAQAPTEKSGRFLQERMDAFRSEIGGHSLAFEARARIDYRDDQFKESRENAKRLMNYDPAQYIPVLGEQLAAIDASSVPPVQKSAIRQKAIDEISYASVYSQLQRSPTTFLQSIGFGVPESGKTRKWSGDLNAPTGNIAFDALPFDKRVQAFEAAIRQQGQIDVDVARQSEAVRKAQADDALKEAYSRRADGKLTRDYIEQIRPIITHQDYRSLIDMAVREAPKQSDPGTLRSILRNMDADPQLALDMTYRAHQNGLLKNEGSDGLTGLRDQAIAKMRQGGPKTEYERSRNFIIGSLDPGPLVHDPVERSRLAEALDAFDRWNIAGQGKRPDEEIQKRGREIVQQFQFINLRDSVAALPSPRSGDIRRLPGDVQGMSSDIDKAAREAKRRYEAGEFNKREYEDEMEILARWIKAVNGVTIGK